MMLQGRPKLRGKENMAGKAKAKEYTAEKGQRQGECGKKRTGSLRGTLRCNKELWESYVVPRYVMGKQ